MRIPIFVCASVALALLSACGGSSSGGTMPDHAFAQRGSGSVAPEYAYSETIAIDHGHAVVRRGGGSAVTSGEWSFSLGFHDATTVGALCRRIDGADADVIAPTPPIGGGQAMLTLDADSYWYGDHLGQFHVFSADVQAAFDAIEALPGAHQVPPPYPPAG